MADVIGSGTVEGLLSYLDALVQKGRSRAGVVTPLKTACKRVLETTEGENWRQNKVADLNVADIAQRFKNLSMGQYSEGSYRTYEIRLRKAIDWYQTFLTNPGWYPTESARAISLQDKIKTDKLVTNHNLSTGREVPAKAAPHTDPNMITYPFPMSDGAVASLQLPRALTRRDAARLGTFLESLVVEVPEGAHETPT